MKRKTKKTNIGKFMKVTWEDHYSASGWQKESDPAPILVTTLGCVVVDTPKMLVLAQSHSGSNGTHGNHMGIIKNCIKSRKIIK